MHTTLLPDLSVHHDRPALSFVDGKDTRWVTWTYEDLRSAVKWERDRLSANVPPGGVVALIMRPHGASVAALLAAASLGNPSILLSPTLTEPETRDILHVSQPAALHTVDVNGSHWEPLPALPTALSGRGDVFVAQLTSGSTGASRLAARTHRGVAGELDAVTGHLNFESDDTVLCGSSLAHSYGLMGALLAPLRQGVHVLVAADPVQSAERIVEQKPSIVFGLASTYRHVLSSTRGGLRPPRLALSAGAPLPVGLFEEVLRQLHFPIRQDYGTTETGTITIDTSTSPRAGQAGNPLDHVQIRLASPTISSLEAGEAGEIHVNSAATAIGYLGPDGLETCVDKEGWYHTLDVGHRDAHGSLYVGRRLRPLIRIGDTLIRPWRVEAVVQSVPGVEEVAALPARCGGEPCLRLVVVAPRLGDAELKALLTERLEPNEQPAILERWPALPRSPAGKVLHKYLE